MSAQTAWDQSTAEKIERLSDWIRANCSPETEFGVDTDLIENRLITSLQLIEFVLFVEELRGQEISDRDRDLDYFRTLRSVALRYLAK